MRGSPLLRVKSTGALNFGNAQQVQNLPVLKSFMLGFHSLTMPEL